MLYGLILLSSLVLGSFILLSLLRPQGLVGSILALAVLSAGQIVLLCEFLSLVNLLNPNGLLLGQLLGLGIISILWLARGRTDLLRSFKGYSQPWRGLGNPILFAFFVGFVLILLASMVGRGRIAAPDAMTYHLPRVHYWLNQGNLFHFVTDDYRQVDFPPNASLLFLWVIVATGSYGLTFLVQSAAGIASAVGTIGLARLAGYSKESALVAGFTFLLAPMVMLQLVTAQIDLITSLFTVSFAFYTIRHFIEHSDTPEWGSDMILAAMSFGLMMGTKLTPLFLLPGLLVFIFILGYDKEFNLVIKRLPVFILACTLGFVLLGVFNYGLNLVEFGNPIASPRALDYEYVDRFARLNQKEVESLRSPVANLVRYAYQTMDWPLLPDTPIADLLFQFNEEIFQMMNDLFNLQLETAPGFDLVEFGRRPISQNRAGFGLIGYLALLSSPIFLVVQIKAGRAELNKARTIKAGYLIVGISWFILFAWVIPWTEVKTRYFTLPFIFLFAALIPEVVDRARHKLPVTAGFLLLLGFQTFQIAQAASYLQSERYMLNERHFEVLRTSFPSKAKVGVRGRVWFPLILEKFPGYSFQIIEDDLKGFPLQESQLDAILTRGLQSPPSLESIPFGPGQEIIVESGVDLLGDNLDAFGLVIDQEDSCGNLMMTDGYMLTRLLEESRQIEFVLPTFPVHGCQHALAIVVNAAQSLSAEDLDELRCRGFEMTDYRSSDGGVVVRGTFEADSRQPLFSCTLVINEAWPGSLTRQSLRVEVGP